MQENVINVYEYVNVSRRGKKWFLLPLDVCLPRSDRHTLLLWICNCTEINYWKLLLYNSFSYYFQASKQAEIDKLQEEILKVNIVTWYAWSFRNKTFKYILTDWFRFSLTFLSVCRILDSGFLYVSLFMPFFICPSGVWEVEEEAGEVSKFLVPSRH